jgi:hypothetical protein
MIAASSPANEAGVSHENEKELAVDVVGVAVKFCGGVGALAL